LIRVGPVIDSNLIADAPSKQVSEVPFAAVLFILIEEQLTTLPSFVKAVACTGCIPANVIASATRKLLLFI
jgi:hypothetical protein